MRLAVRLALDTLIAATLSYLCYTAGRWVHEHICGYLHTQLYRAEHYPIFTEGLDNMQHYYEPSNPLMVVVPRPNTDVAKIVLEGSAIVASPTIPEIREEGSCVIDYEGGIYSHQTWNNYLMRAVGRHREFYPTIARRFCNFSDLVEVGFVDEDGFHVDMTREPLLEAWVALRESGTTLRDGMLADGLVEERNPHVTASGPVVVERNMVFREGFIVPGVDVVRRARRIPQHWTEES